MSGMSEEAFAETLDFWRRMGGIRWNGRPGLRLGGNSTLAEALVTFRLLTISVTNDHTKRLRQTITLGFRYFSEAKRSVPGVVRVRAPLK